MRLLIAFDGSECARDAIRELACAGLPAEVEACVVSVAEPYPALPEASYGPISVNFPATGVSMVEAAHELAAAALIEARKLAEEGAALVREEFPEWQVTTEARGGSTAQQILEAAEAQAPDLLVVGSHGRSALGRVVFGSVSEKLVRYARGSVRVARCRAGRAVEPIRVLLAYDGSTQSMGALDAVAERSWPEDTEIRIVTVVDVGLALSFAKRVEKGGATSMEDLAGEAAGRLRRVGIEATSAIHQGDPKHVLVREAAAWDAECVFLGARGHSPIERFLLGSVSAAVVSRAHCSVEIVRAAAGS